MQATILPISEKFVEYGKSVHVALVAAGIRSELADANESLGKRIREAELLKTPYVLVVGEKEAAAGTVAVRTRGRDGEKATDEGAMPLEDFVKKIASEIKEKK